MAKFLDFVIDRFNGLVANKSDLEMDRSEFKRLINVDLEEVGKAKRRRGIRQAGDTKSGKTIDNSFIFTRDTGGSFLSHHLVITREADAVLYNLLGTYTKAAVATTDTVITVGSTGNFAASGTIEIEGDLIAYTGTTATTFTGCSGIRVAHPINVPVQQLVVISAATGIDTRIGAYFAVLNNVCVINGGTAAGSSKTFDGTSLTDISDADEPLAIFDTNYRSRIYRAGRGSGASSAIRVSFSDPADATSWDVNNYFDVEDNSGEQITGLMVGEDILVIFKTNSIWAYDEVQLKQRVSEVGAYNHRVLQKINDQIFTFCPAGVYVTNGFSARKISDPVDKYLRMFLPIVEINYLRVVTNTFAGHFQDKYLLYIGTIPDPDDSSKTLSDVVLIYDTVRKNWTVHTNYTNFTHFGSFNGFWRGVPAAATDVQTTQYMESLFAGDSNGKYWRLYENKFFDNGTTRTLRGGDLTASLQSDDAGQAVSMELETKWLDLGSPLTWKFLPEIAAVVEQGEFNLAYRLEEGKAKTDWIEIVGFQAGIKIKKLPRNKGYRIKLRATSNSTDQLPILNALILKNPESIDRPQYVSYD